MYCNYSLSMKNSVTAIVTELDSNPDKRVPISIRAGYAFDKNNKEVDFWKLVNGKFVKAVVTKYDLGGGHNEQQTI